MANLNIPKSIKMVVTDFDGVLTDGSIYVDENLSITRKVNFKDIMGISLLKKSDIQIAMISGEKNPIMDLFAERFNIKENHQNIRQKLEILQSIVERHRLNDDEYLYIGDDVNDLGCLNFASVRITVPNATKKVKEVDNIQITESSGGNGAFREVADCILNS